MDNAGNEEEGELPMSDHNQDKFLEDDRLFNLLLADPEVGRSAGRARGSFGANYVRRAARKKKLLYTQLLSPSQPALLDDESPRMVQLVLNKINMWEFSAFQLDRFSGGHSLIHLCVHMFYRAGLITHFRMDPVDVISFFSLVERGYHDINPYHTSLHATDVTQAISVFCHQPALSKHITKLELLATMVAAVGHDLDHPGVNEKFLVSTGSHLAILYDNVSVLENHHWRSAVACFTESGLSKCLSDSEFVEFTDLVRSLVLATDISRQQEFLNQFRYFLDTGNFDTSHTDHRHFILQIAIKCADISNPCRAWNVSRLWSLRACEEFFRQGDRERDLGMLVTPICDRFNVTVAKVQVGFYRYIAEPLFVEWHRFLSSKLSSSMLANLYSNRDMWEKELVVEETVSSMESSSMTTSEVSEEPQINIVSPAPSSLISAKPTLPLHRRLSLPTSDPLHRMFDAMTQPDHEQPRTSGHLRRNFSLTERRRSSLLRGLHGRSSLKPTRGRINRPASVCLENFDNPTVPHNLQTREKRLSSSAQQSVDVLPIISSSQKSPDKPEEMQTESGEKENSVMPSAFDCLIKRRGSAPSNLVLAECQKQTPSSVLIQHHQTSCLTVSNRRGSLPSELLNESLPKQLKSRLLAGPTNGSKNNRPGLLRRRSMGPELLSLAGTNQAFKDRQLVQKYLNRPF